ncbi:MAG TPA: hypothetical protein DCG72_05315 [Gammaproteobacteria bacterium]|nr:hypothetical protein [Pseudomonadales bacterium]MDC3327567.1 hypothetical protein [Pseudomonadales bacterium]HAF38388.1 hypothetical protein [Gammaproteobacteria bacterium]
MLVILLGVGAPDVSGFSRRTIRFAVSIVLLSLFGCRTALPGGVSSPDDAGSLNDTGMVACQFAAAHHPKVAHQKVDRTRGDASATARRHQQAAAQDCNRLLTSPE